MITVTEIIGAASDPRIAERLHQLEHHDRVEYLTIQGSDIERRRLRGRTDKGTDVAVALSRIDRLSNGAVLILSEDRAIIVRTNEQRWMKLAPRDLDAAVALGYFIGNLHWRVRFEPGAILVALDGPEGDFQARLEAFLSSGEARMVRDA